MTTREKIVKLLDMVDNDPNVYDNFKKLKMIDKEILLEILLDISLKDKDESYKISDDHYLEEIIVKSVNEYESRKKK